MHVRIQGIRTGRQLGRARTHDVMTSSSLGRCASGAQRGGNIASLFLSVRANVVLSRLLIPLLVARHCMCSLLRSTLSKLGRKNQR